jgi:hypothetical protein
MYRRRRKATLCPGGREDVVAVVLAIDVMMMTTVAARIGATVLALNERLEMLRATQRRVRVGNNEALSHSISRSRGYLCGCVGVSRMAALQVSIQGRQAGTGRCL